MLKATTLTAVAMVVAAMGPSAAFARFDLNPAPRGVAIVQTQAQSASPVQHAPPTSGAGVAHRVAVVKAPRCPRVGPCISPAGTPYLGTTVTHYAGVVPGSSTTHYPGVVPGTSTTHYPGVIPVSGNHAGEASHLTATGAPAAAATGGGFDWGDGAIGALVVLGVMAAGFGASTLARRRTHSLTRIGS